MGIGLRFQPNKIMYFSHFLVQNFLFHYFLFLEHCVLLPMAAGTTTILMVMTVLLLLLPYLSNNI